MGDREEIPEDLQGLEAFRKWLELFRENARQGSMFLVTGFPDETTTDRGEASASFWNRSDLAAKVTIRAEVQDGKPVLTARLFTGSTQEEMNEKVSQAFRDRYDHGNTRL